MSRLPAGSFAALARTAWLPLLVGSVAAVLLYMDGLYAASAPDAAPWLGWLDVVGVVAIGSLAWLLHAHPRWRDWQRTLGVALAALVVHLVLMAAHQRSSLFSWSMAETWAVCVLAAAYAARSGRWPDDRLNPALALLCIAAAMLTPMSEGMWTFEGFLSGFAYFGVFFLATALFGVMARSQRLKVTDAKVEARELERRRMADELHDVVAHDLTGIVVMAQALGATVADPRLAGELGRIEKTGRRALTSIRALVSVTGEQSGVLTPHGAGLSEFSTLLAEFAATFDGEVAQVIDVREDDVDAHVGTALHRVLTESLTNIRRHAATSTRVEVRLVPHAAGLRLTITDDGVGGGLGTGGGNGLVGLRERVALAGGTLVAGPAESGGWSVQVDFSGPTTDNGGRA